LAAEFIGANNTGKLEMKIHRLTDALGGAGETSARQPARPSALQKMAPYGATFQEATIGG